MDFEPYLPLIKKMSQATFDFGRKIGEISQNPSFFEKIFESIIKDATIDPGDLEDATEKLVQAFQDMSEYCDMMEFYRQNRKEIAKLNLMLSKTTESEYIAYTELLQRISTEMAVNLVFDTLRKQGIVKDNR